MLYLARLMSRSCRILARVVPRSHCEYRRVPLSFRVLRVACRARIVPHPFYVNLVLCHARVLLCSRRTAFVLYRGYPRQRLWRATSRLSHIHIVQCP